MKIEMAPSILSADFMALGSDVRMIADGGADWIHVDVMDGHFVPNLTLGVPFVKALKKLTKTPLDVHLMISNPEVQVPWFLDAGADAVTVHIEAFEDAGEARATLGLIRSHGAKAGISLNPETPVSAIEGVLDAADIVLVMSVHPGFGGQSFIEDSPDKIRAVRAACSEMGASPVIEVDGGIGVDTAPLVAEAGATMLVAGSAVFRNPRPVSAMEEIRFAASR